MYMYPIVIFENILDLNDDCAHKIMNIRVNTVILIAEKRENKSMNKQEHIM